MPTNYKPLANCSHPNDLELIDPYEYTRLASTPATMLDLMRLELKVVDALHTIHGSTNERG